MNKNAIIVTSVGVVIGVAEALLYYNLGKNEGGKFKYNVPPTRDFLKTIGIVFVTSMLTAAISGGIEKIFVVEEVVEKEKPPVPH